MVDITTTLWILSILIAGGALSGFLAGLFGIGGGAIMVPIFYQIFAYYGVDEAIKMHMCVGTSLAVIVPTSLRSWMAHRKHGQINIEILKDYFVFVPLGVLLATLVVSEVTSVTLRVIFTVLCLLVGFRMVINRENWIISRELPSRNFRRLAGTIIGALSAFMGIGGGVLNNTFMTLFGRPLHEAISTSSAVGVLISIPAVFGYMWAGWGHELLPSWSAGFVNLAAFFVVLPVTLLIAPFGVRMAHHLNKRQLEVLFGLFIFSVGGRFFFSLYFAS